MIYDPSRRALELRQRILQSMTADEIEGYAKECAERVSEVAPAGSGTFVG